MSYAYLISLLDINFQLIRPNLLCKYRHYCSRRCNISFEFPLSRGAVVALCLIGMQRQVSTHPTPQTSFHTKHQTHLTSEIWQTLGKLVSQEENTLHPFIWDGGGNHVCVCVCVCSVRRHDFCTCRAHHMRCGNVESVSDNGTSSF